MLHFVIYIHRNPKILVFIPQIIRIKIVNNKQQIDFSKQSPKFSKTVSVKTNLNFTAVITLLERKVS